MLVFRSTIIALPEAISGCEAVVAAAVFATACGAKGTASIRARLNKETRNFGMMSIQIVVHAHGLRTAGVRIY
ncbi:hypothetical protein ECZC01_19690 [Escherichia coli]|nr:hypothetical protein TUM13867_16280 [Escherichia coli]BDG98516.1 hypothetical protein TUM20902_16300 [Escherichia coli]BEA86988.1 hypothetical protein VEE03_15710 [Escherichia coli]GHK38537.1 hypothetical protein ECZU06_56620 [Escherichia coli]GHK64702.1 hypothetical protein ECZU11_12520 [Escherichia coli]